MATVQDFLQCPKWVKRIDEAFHLLDKNGDGFVSEEAWTTNVDNLAKAVTDRPNAIAKLRAATLEFTTALGLTEGVKADKKKFRELVANMVVEEIAKVKRGEETLVEKMEDLVFDVVDTSRDGTITLEEYSVLMKAMNFPEDAAEAAFALLDKNKSGKVNREVYKSSYFKFWFHLDDPEVQGMFGSKFE